MQSPTTTTVQQLPPFIKEAQTCGRRMQTTWAECVLRETCLACLRRCAVLNAKTCNQSQAASPGVNNDNDNEKAKIEQEETQEMEICIHLSEFDVQQAYEVAARVGWRWARHLEKAGEVEMAQVVREVIETGDYLEKKEEGSNNDEEEKEHGNGEGNKNMENEDTQQERNEIREDKENQQESHKATENIDDTEERNEILEHPDSQQKEDQNQKQPPPEEEPTNMQKQSKPQPTPNNKQQQQHHPPTLPKNLTPKELHLIQNYHNRGYDNLLAKLLGGYNNKHDIFQHTHQPPSTVIIPAFGQPPPYIQLQGSPLFDKTARKKWLRSRIQILNALGQHTLNSKLDTWPYGWEIIQKASRRNALRLHECHRRNIKLVSEKMQDYKDYADIHNEDNDDDDEEEEEEFEVVPKSVSALSFAQASTANSASALEEQQQHQQQGVLTNAIQTSTKAFMDKDALPSKQTQGLSHHPSATTTTTTFTTTTTENDDDDDFTSSRRIQSVLFYKRRKHQRQQRRLQRLQKQQEKLKKQQEQQQQRRLRRVRVSGRESEQARWQRVYKEDFVRRRVALDVEEIRLFWPEVVEELEYMEEEQEEKEGQQKEKAEDEEEEEEKEKCSEDADGQEKNHQHKPHDGEKLAQNMIHDYHHHHNHQPHHTILQGALKDLGHYHYKRQTQFEADTVAAAKAAKAAALKETEDGQVPQWKKNFLKRGQTKKKRKRTTVEARSVGFGSLEESEDDNDNDTDNDNEDDSDKDKEMDEEEIKAEEKRTIARGKKKAIRERLGGSGSFSTPGTSSTTTTAAGGATSNITTPSRLTSYASNNYSYQRGSGGGSRMRSKVVRTDRGTVGKKEWMELDLGECLLRLDVGVGKEGGKILHAFSSLELSLLDYEEEEEAVVVVEEEDVDGA